MFEQFGPWANTGINMGTAAAGQLAAGPYKPNVPYNAPQMPTMMNRGTNAAMSAGDAALGAVPVVGTALSGIASGVHQGLQQRAGDQYAQKLSQANPAIASGALKNPYVAPDRGKEALRGGPGLSSPLSGAMTGAGIGMAGGPLGALAGGLIGGAAGFFGGRARKSDEQARLKKSNQIMQQNKAQITGQRQQANAQQVGRRQMMAPGPQDPRMMTAATARPRPGQMRVGGMTAGPNAQAGPPGTQDRIAASTNKPFADWANNAPAKTGKKNKAGANAALNDATTPPYGNDKLWAKYKASAAKSGGNASNKYLNDVMLEQIRKGLDPRILQGLNSAATRSAQDTTQTMNDTFARTGDQSGYNMGMQGGMDMALKNQLAEIYPQFLEKQQNWLMDQIFKARGTKKGAVSPASSPGGGTDWGSVLGGVAGLGNAAANMYGQFKAQPTTTPKS